MTNIVAGIIHGNDPTLIRNDRTTTVAGERVSAVFDDRINRGPRRLAIGILLGHDAVEERVFGIAQRETSGEDRHARSDWAVMPLEIVETVTFDIDHGKVRAL